MYTQAIGKWWVGWDLNPRPTPKAFGAALPLSDGLGFKQMQGNGWAFLGLQRPLEGAGFGQRGEFGGGGQFERVAETLGGVGVTASMFGKPTLKVGGGADVVAAVAPTQNVYPGHRKVVGWVGFEPTTNGLKGRCSTTELPTHLKIKQSTIARDLNPRPTPNAFGAALPLSYQPSKKSINNNSSGFEPTTNPECLRGCSCAANLSEVKSGVLNIN
jgi:hypothetical protein